MFWRMLKKDLADKKGLNLILLIFMCLASVLTVASAIILYLNTAGKAGMYDRVNAADVAVLTVRDLNGVEENQEEVISWLTSREDVEDVELSQMIRIRSNAISFEGFSNDEYSSIVNTTYYACDLSAQHDLATDLDGDLLDLPYGTDALPQSIHRETGLKIGDTVNVVTQMGNIYEFRVGAFTKDPSVTQWSRIIFNNEDFEVLLSESPVTYDLYMVDMKGFTASVDETQLISDLREKEDQFGEIVSSNILHGYNAANEVAIATNATMIIVASFLIVMVFMTVSFTIRTAIKSEEKELGMLKALGIESVSFNWLFAAKYLALSAIGTLAGFGGGIALAGIYIKYLDLGMLMPSVRPLIILAAASSLMIFMLIILFVAVALRRMKKISIMDVIAGENRGERFGKIPGLFLHRIKNINIPFYLALTDLFTKIKRYSFLILAYVRGMALIITMLEINNTINTDYWIIKYWGRPPFDFIIDLPDDVMDSYTERGGSVRGAYDVINEELKAEGIPAHVGYFGYYLPAVLTYDGREYEAQIQFNFPYKADGELDRGVNPVLRNEVIMDEYHAWANGIGIGDTVSLQYYRYSGDGLTSDLVTEDFIVTGLIDSPTARMNLIMSDAFEGCARGDVYQSGNTIDAPQEKYPEVLEQLRAKFGNGSVRDRQEEVMYSLNENGDLSTIMLYILIPLIVLMMILVTVLYLSINLLDETSEIALLKCTGFSNGDIKAWQILRALLMLLATAVTAVIMDNTLVLLFIRKIFVSIGNIMHFEPNKDILHFYVLTPVLIIAGILLVVSIVIRKVNSIELWRIRND